jgi:aminoglycoside/choline kinase family phosphotransferase
VAEARAFPGLAPWKTAACEPLTGDASARKYFRLRAGNQTAILMDASRVPDSVAPFIRIAGHLRQIGFSAPEIFARDAESGLLLLEDFGDATFAQLLEQRGCDAPSQKVTATPPSRVLEMPAAGDEASPSPTATRASQPHETLFTLATDVLIALHRHPQAVPENLREYHPEKMLEDIELFVQWRTPNVTALEKDDFRAAWRAVLPLAHRVPASLLLRDYHVANLMLLPDRAGIRRAGLLDFQDAYRGPVTYDLVSLLQDARRDVPEALQEKLLVRYLAAFPELDQGLFETSLAILAAQRHTRVLGIFERLARHEGKLDYRQLHSPRVERLLRRALRHPILAGVKNWMERHVLTD